MLLRNPQQWGKPAYLMLVLPFKIERVVPGFNSSWALVRPSTDAAATAIYMKLSNDSKTATSTVLYTQFLVSRTFEASKRAMHTITLPFQAAVGGPYFQEVETLQRDLGVSLRTQLAEIMHVYISVPLSVENPQTFPEADSRSPYVRPSDNYVMSSIQWILTEQKAVTVSYLDEQSASVYESSVILGSLFLGVGASGVLNWLRRVSDVTEENVSGSWYRC